MALGLLAVSAFHCLAEDRSIFGLNFEVESLIDSSSEVTELHVLGTTQSVPKNEVDLKIVSLFFNTSDTERTTIRVDEIPLNRLEQFTVQAAEADSIEIAAYGLYALGLHSESTLEIMRTNLDRVKAVSKSLQIIESANTLVDQTKKLFAPHFAISIANCEVTAKSNYNLPQDYEFRTKLYYYAAAETTRLLINRKIDPANNILTCMRSTFNSKELNIINIERLNKILPETIQDFEKKRDYKFPNTSDLASGDKELEEVLTDSLSIYLLSSSKKFLTDNDPGYSLWLISRIPESRRSLETFELTEKSLSKLENNTEKAILAPGVSNYLLNISKSNPLFKAQYIKVLVQLTDQLLKEEKPERLQVILGLLIALNPDPNAINDTVRVNLASYYVNRGARDMGLGVYAGLKGALPLSKKLAVWLRITWLKYPLTCIVLISSLLGGLLFVLFCRVKRSQAIVRLSKLHLGTDSPDDSKKLDEAINRPLFVKQGFSQQLTLIAQEYANLTLFFGLEPDCSIKDIKYAYRDKMKRLHPDMNMQTAKATEAEEIMSTRKAYERLLDIHKKKLISDEEITVLKKRGEIRNNQKNY